MLPLWEVLGMKDMVPKRADNEAADLIGAVSKNALQLRMRLAGPQAQHRGSGSQRASLSWASSPSRKDLGLCFLHSGKRLRD